MPVAVVNGIRTSYETYGTGVPVLFIHGGYGGAQSTLVPQINTVANILPRDRIQTITYDRRNAGASEYIATEYTVHDLAADAAGLLDYLGHERAFIVGSSAGGPIALGFALTYPERVIGLALPNTGPDLSSTERAAGRNRRALVAKAKAEGDEAVFQANKASMRTAVAGTGIPASPEAAQRIAERTAKLQVELDRVGDDDLRRYYSGELRNYGAYIDIDFTDRLSEIALPTFIVHGDNDQTVPYAWGQLLHEKIKGSEFVTVPGGGHGITQWPQAGEALREWVLRVIG